MRRAWDDPLIMGLAPYDLVIANILAGPLIELAPSLSAQLAEGGSLILAGLLESQADHVIAAYRAQGLRLAARADHGDWPTLHLRKRRRYGWRRRARWSEHDNGEKPKITGAGDAERDAEADAFWRPCGAHAGGGQFPVGAGAGAAE